MNGLVNIYGYWEQVTDVAASLPEGDAFLMVSVELPGVQRAGARFWMDRQQTAEALVKKTHRLADRDEIDAYKLEQESTGKSIVAENERRKQQVVHNHNLALPPEIADALKVIPQLQQQLAHAPKNGRSKPEGEGEK
jgi:hypothetical protein